jgi:hypothetical protein
MASLKEPWHSRYGTVSGIWMDIAAGEDSITWQTGAG